MNKSAKKAYPNIAQSFGIIGIVILGMLFLSPVNLILNKIIGEEASMLIYYILAIGLPFYLVYKIRKDKTKEDSFNLDLKNKRIVPFIIVGTIALLFGVITPIGNLIPMPESIKEIFMEFGSQSGIFSFLLLVVAAPVLEELICRGIILDGLLKNYSPWKSILVSSFLFGFLHLNPWQFVTGFVIGIFSGWVYYRTRSLLPSIIIHTTANLTAFLMRFLVSDISIDETLVESYGGLTNLILIISGAVILILLCVYFLNKEFKRTEVALTTPR